MTFADWIPQMMLAAECYERRTEHADCVCRVGRALVFGKDFRNFSMVVIATRTSSGRASSEIRETRVSACLSDLRREDLKSWVPKGACGFDARPRHSFLGNSRVLRPLIVACRGRTRQLIPF
jgi:hypothetical protein